MTISGAQFENPIPRKVEAHFPLFHYPTTGATYLNVPIHFPEVGFRKILERRRTRRAFRSISTEALSAFLWVGLKAYSTRKSTDGRVETQHRASPSAGGKQVVDALVFRRISRRWTCSLYDPVAHALCVIDCSQRDVTSFVLSVSKTIPVMSGTLLWMLADRNRLRRHYKNEQSLLWRDAGVILGTLSLVAEYLGLSSCAVGSLGFPKVSSLFPGANRLVSLGGLIVGSSKSAIPTR